MVGEEKPLGFVCANDGYVAESPLLSPFADNRAAANSKLLVKDEVLHLLQKWEMQNSNYYQALKKKCQLQINLRWCYICFRLLNINRAELHILPMDK